MVNSAPAMVFMKGTPESPACRFSGRMIRILDEHGVVYSHFNIPTGEDVWANMKEFADWPTFPQLWANSELVGGLDVVNGHVGSCVHPMANVSEQVKDELEADNHFFQTMTKISTQKSTRQTVAAA